ncbi:MAG: hypothetical protein ABJA66_02800, partial [Actinomycetota bacterium]
DFSSSTPAKTPTVSPSSSPSSTEESGKFGLKTGTYKGTGKNSTYNKTGDFLLRIDSVSSSGTVNAYFEASNGLGGRSSLTGKITDEGKLTLDGTLEDGKAFSISATVSGDTISAGYGIAGNGEKTQSGTFTVNRR